MRERDRESTCRLFLDKTCFALEIDCPSSSQLSVLNVQTLMDSSGNFLVFSG